MAKVAARLPWHVRVVSVALNIVGLVNIVYWFAVLFGYGRANVSIGSLSRLLYLLTSAAMIVIGTGLWRHKRWAWVAGVILYALGLAWVVWLVAFYSYGPRADGFWFAVIPSVLVLWSLAAPGTRRAFLD